MKLLIITQKVDIDDDNLGFFHDWIERFAKKVDKVYVICLFRGRHNLPNNVQVFSLGKESRVPKLKYIFNLYRYFCFLRKKVDIIFVHMNQIYVLLIGPFSKLFNLPICLWKVRIGKIPYFRQAIWLADKVFTASKDSLDYETPKKTIMGHGIDTNLFKPRFSYPKIDSSVPFKILAIGRMSPIKNFGTLIEAINVLVNQKRMEDIEVKIVGGASTDKQKKYLAYLKRKTEHYNLQDSIDFIGPVIHKDTVKYYQECDLCVSFSSSGGLDKVLLEAMSCGRLVCTSQVNLSPFLGEYKERLMVKKENPEVIASKIQTLLKLDQRKKREIGQYLRRVVVENHDLDNLISALIEEFKKLI